MCEREREYAAKKGGDIFGRKRGANLSSAYTVPAMSYVYYVLHNQGGRRNPTRKNKTGQGRAGTNHLPPLPMPMATS